MNINGEQSYNFTNFTDNDDKKSIPVPLSTLNEIVEKMQLSQSDILELMKSNHDAKLGNVVSRISFVIGAIEYYLEEKVRMLNRKSKL